MFEFENPFHLHDVLTRFGTKLFRILNLDETFDEMLHLAQKTKN